MFRRVVLSVLVAAVFSFADGYGQSHDRGEVLAADTLIVRLIPDGQRADRIHLRAGLPSSGDFEWGLVLKDTQGSRRIVISGNTDDLIDGDYPAAIFFTDSVACIIRKRVSHTSGADDYSLRITGRYGEFGSRYSDYDFELRDSELVEASAFLSRGMCLRRFDVTSVPADKPQTCAFFEDLTGLSEYIGSSKDPREGLWTYFDRNLDYKDCMLGGRYLLACVSDGDGGYLLLYVDGAERGARIWSPLMIKGRLRPTAFAGHFDLTWTDAFGRTEPHAESSASFDLDDSLLTLDFPLYGRSQLRFMKSK